MFPPDQPIREVSQVAAIAILGDGLEGVTVEPRARYFAIYIEGVVAAIGSLELRRRLAVLSMDYTLPAFRSRGLHRQLIAFRLVRAKAAGAVNAQASCLKPSIRNYLSAGFVITAQRKHGWLVRRAL